MMHMVLSTFRLLSVITILAAAAWGQEAEISGTIRDSSGAVIPDAAVTLVSTQQGTTRTVQSNATGVYRIPFVQPGTYDISVLAKGFKKSSRSNVVLQVAQQAGIDFTLEVGGAQEIVTVEAGAEMLKTESTEVADVVDNKHVVEMPLNGRQFYSLALIAPGVLPDPPNASNSTRGGMNIAGSGDRANAFTLNGFANTDVSIFVPNFRPSVDAIEEFDVITGVAPAEYGYGSGGHIIVTTKSGTNSIHGSAYNFLRNQVMDARNFFSAPGPLPSFKQNQFGATVGGPVIRNRTFFFFSYEGLRLSQQETAVTTVPTPAMVTGDFSGISKVIKDPSTGAAFAGNMIPASRISPIAAALATFYPAPTFATAAGALPSNNFITAGTRTETLNEWSLRLDHHFSLQDSMLVSLNYFNDPTYEFNSNGCGTQYLPGRGCVFGNKTELWGISETHIFSPTIVNEYRMSIMKAFAPRYSQDPHVSFDSQWGIVPTVTPSVYPGLPTVNITGFAPLGEGYSPLPQNENNREVQTLDFADTVSWTHGKHTVKIGGELIRNHVWSNPGSNITGTLTFTNTSTGPTTGYGFADLLLGYPASTQSTPFHLANSNNASTPAAFIQDDYKVTPYLTLNVGLRWELNTPITQNFGRLTNFDTVKGIPVIQGTDGFGEHVWSFDWHDYGPRVGIAWQPFHDGKTVVRAASGMFYNALLILQSLSALSSGYPFTYNNSYSSSLAQPILISNPFPVSNAVVSATVAGADPTFKNAKVTEWSLGIQRQLPKDMLFSVTYFGSKSIHLMTGNNINQPPPGPGTPAQVNARRPYPAWNSIAYWRWDADGRYESLMAELQKRYSSGLTFVSSFTYGKSIDDTATPTNTNDLQTATGLSSFDVRARFVVSPVYELPFGKGKPFLSTGPAALLAGGWQLSGLFQWQSGLPATPTLSGNYSNTGGTTDRPNVIGDPNSNAPHTVQKWFNTAAFQVPVASGQPNAPYTFGNAGVGVITGPGIVNLDASIVRNFQPREWLRVQFRGEFYNALNHPNFYNPNTVADTPAFGTITSAAPPRQIQLALKISF